MTSNMESNVNVTPIETEEGIVRLVPQTTDIEMTPTTIGSLINPPVSSTIIPHINQLAPIATTLNNPPASTSIPLSNLLMSPITSLNNAPISTVTSLSNTPASTIVSLNNTSVSTVTSINNNAPVSTSPVLNNPTVVTTTQQNIVLQQPLQQQQPQQQPANKSVINVDDAALLTKARLRELVKEVDPNEQLEEDVEDLMLQISDDFVDELVRAACVFAKHRKSNIVEVKDVQLYLERYLNMWIPGFGTDELKPYKKAPITEAHKQRIALIKKVSSKKY